MPEIKVWNKSKICWAKGMLAELGTLIFLNFKFLEVRGSTRLAGVKKLSQEGFISLLLTWCALSPQARKRTGLVGVVVFYALLQFPCLPCDFCVG